MATSPITRIMVMCMSNNKIANNIYYFSFFFHLRRGVGESVEKCPPRLTNHLAVCVLTSDGADNGEGNEDKVRRRVGKSPAPQTCREDIVSLDH